MKDNFNFQVPQNPVGSPGFSPNNMTVNANPNFNYGSPTTAGYNTDGVASQVGSAIGSGLGSIGSALLGGVGGLAGGALNLIGGLLNQRAQRKENEKARAFQTSEREAQNEWNLEMWNRQNEYNDPSAQMQRMLEAGINPAAAAQGISGAGSTAGAVQGASNGGAPNNPLPDNGLGRLGDAIGNSTNSALSAMSLNQQIQNQQEQMKQTMLQNEGIKTANESANLDLKLKQDTYETNVAIIKQTFSNLVESGKLTGEQAVAAGLANYITSATADDSIESMKLLVEEKRQTVNNLMAQYDNLLKQRDVMSQQIKTMKAQQADYEASAEYKALMSEHQKLENDMKQIERDFAVEMGYTENMGSVSQYLGFMGNLYGNGNVLNPEAARRQAGLYYSAFQNGILQSTQHGHELHMQSNQIAFQKEQYGKDRAQRYIIQGIQTGTELLQHFTPSAGQALQAASSVAGKGKK